MNCQRVTFVRNEALQYREIFLLAAAGAIIDPSCQRGDVGKRLVRGQKSPNLEVGIQAGFDAPKQFNYQTVAVHRRAVALFSLQHAGFERRFMIAAQLLKRLGRARYKLAHRRSMTPRAARLYRSEHLENRAR